MPTVSIIMPCYNAVAHLPKSVGSIQAQSFADWELIAVNDGSHDDTLGWLESLGDPRVRVLSQENQGASTARNAGLQIAQGSHVAFLDADDTWEPAFLEKLLAALEAHPDAVLAYCGWQNLGLPGGRGEPFVPPNYETPNKLETLFVSCRWPIHGALTRRSAIEAAGRFNTSLHNAEDYLLWLCVATSAPIVQVPEVLAYYHFHDPSRQTSRMSPANAALDHLRAQRIFLASHPDAASRLGPGTIRKLTYGRLLGVAYELYWQRNLEAARQLFRKVMRGLYGAPADWKYMLPALLPLHCHERLMQFVDRVKGKR